MGDDSRLKHLRLYGELAMGGHLPGGDRGSSFPASDAADLANGASYIPWEVTDTRRAGKFVAFVRRCTTGCWFWLLPNGDRHYHATGSSAGECALCGNPHAGAELVKAQDVRDPRSKLTLPEPPAEYRLVERYDISGRILYDPATGLEYTDNYLQMGGRVASVAEARHYGQGKFGK